MKKIKSSVKEEKVAKRIAVKLTSVVNKRIRAQLLGAVAGLVGGFVGMVAPFVVLWYGISMVMQDVLTVGAFFAINGSLG